MDKKQDDNEYDRCMIAEQIIENLPFPVIAIGLDKSIIYLNGKAKNMIAGRDLPCYESLLKNTAPCIDCPMDNGYFDKNHDQKTLYMKSDSPGHIFRSISPLYADGKLEGVIEQIAEMTASAHIGVEKSDVSVIQKKQSEMKDIFMSIIPVLTRKVCQGDRNLVIKDIGDRVEAYMESVIMENMPDDRTRLACVCEIFNEMGGNFTAVNREDHIEISGTVCPWGDDAVNNPILCNITKMIFSRSLYKEKLHVDLVESIGNRDDRCLLRAYRKL
ncbi:hypothetical protein CUJ83_11700 [Methanocella sp. CWC-04]|uniref:Metanogen output domain-containing protein n=1 Tax=Methanooceanicella nereidis TaxID=2052831 RepID=A0AAP2W829_9EURY|nr:methanogen output domain 1-containing protein [Methanocella sp. CWC-04]MCD1295661.1 hypothetical protein [Methanocella sp. CWC-04]